MEKEEKKDAQLGKVAPSLNKALVDYAKLIGISKIKLLEELISNELEGRILTKGFIVPDKPFYFNIEELFEKGTVKASTNKPSNSFNKYYTVKKIANNLDSKNAEYRTYCYNDNKYLHKGIFIYYIFSKEAKPVPLVFDYNSKDKELVISLIEIEQITYLIESEEDVVTVENLLKSVEDNVKNYSSAMATPELDLTLNGNVISNKKAKFYNSFINSITSVIEDFQGRKKIDLLSKYDVNEFDKIFSEDEIKFNFVAGREFNPDETITTEDIFKKLLQQEAQLNNYNSTVKELKGTIKEFKEWFNMIDNEEERNNIWNELSSEKKKD